MRYKAEPDGRITKDGQQIGSFDLESGLMTLPEELNEVGKVHIKAQVFDILLSRLKDRAQAKPEGKTLIEVFASEQEPSCQDIEKREDWPRAQIPPEPEMDPKLGDKTPAWMQWLATYFPEKFKVRFKGRKTHLTTGINPHLSSIGDVPESSFAKEATEEWK